MTKACTYNNNNDGENCIASCLVDLDDAYGDLIFVNTTASVHENARTRGHLQKARSYFVAKKNSFLAPAVVETSDSSSESEDSSSDPSGDKSTRQVSFAGVSIREYEPTVADSPNPTIYPIGLGWKHSETITLGLKEFENSFYSASIKNPFGGTVRGFRRPRRLTAADRFTRLANFSGLTVEELYDLESTRSKRNKKKIKQQQRRPVVDGGAGGSVVHKPYQRVDLDHYARISV